VKGQTPAAPRARAPEAREASEAKPKIVGGVPESEALALLPTEMVTGTTPFFPPTAARGLEAVAPANAETSDEALVLAIRRGDRHLGRQIYRRLIRVIESTLCRVLGRREGDHNDLIQAVFEEIVRTIHSGQFQMRCSLTSWAATIACHIGLNAIRARRMERAVFEREQPLEDFGNEVRASTRPEQALDARDELRQVTAALAAMPEGRAEAVLMHDVLGYGLAEIAALSGSTAAAVQSRLVRGRKELLERIEALRAECTESKGGARR
jgi:RNA polymerase sigma-70 factor (ECF subfamily)